MSDLTKEEKAWVRKMERLLANAPERFGFYTIGDPDLMIFDRSKEHLFDEDEDMPMEVTKYDAHLCWIRFPQNVHGVCG